MSTLNFKINPETFVRIIDDFTESPRYTTAGPTWLSNFIRRQNRSLGNLTAEDKKLPHVKKNISTFKKFNRFNITQLGILARANTDPDSTLGYRIRKTIRKPIPIVRVEGEGNKSKRKKSTR